MGRFRTIWLSLYSLALFGAATAQALDTIELEARLDDAERMVFGQMAVTFGPERPRNDLRFRLYPNAAADSASPVMTVDSITVNGEDVSDQVAVDRTDLYVALPPSLTTAPTAEVKLYFSTEVPEAYERFGYFSDHYALETWFPMPAPIRDGQWRKIEYAPTAEPVADFYDFKVTLTYPDSLQLIAPGIKSVDTADEVTAHIILDGAHEMPLLFARQLACKSQNLNDTRIDVYYGENSRPYVDTTMQLVLSTMQFMSDSILTYPYDELIVVIGGTPAGFGLEMPRMIWLPSRTWDVVTIHEVIHQWFYGMLNSDQAAHPWLDEAITEYFTIGLLRKSQETGSGAIEFLGLSVDYTTLLRVIGRQYFGLLPITHSASEYDWRTYQPTIYYKGTFLMQTITALMGPEKEIAFWRDYASTYAMARPTPEDFYSTADKYLEESGVTAAEIIGMVGDLDFSIVDIRSEEILEAEADGADSLTAAGRYRSEVDWSARYPLPSPVTIRVEFDGGELMDTVLTPTSGDHTLVFEGRDQPIISAVIDPEGVYAIDVDYLNNSLLLYSHSAGVRLFSGLTYLLQLLTGVAWSW